MSKNPVRDVWLLDLRNPDRVEHSGHGYGGPLKLYHRDRNYIIIKWPSYTQWSGVGCRDSNQTTYFLLRITEEDPMIDRSFVGKPPKKWPGWAKAIKVKEIEPGRKRSLVKALVEECKKLADEWEAAN